MPYDIIIGRDESDKKRFGKKGLVFIGKGYVKMGRYTSLSNHIYLDVARSHVILVAGKRGSGKSYTLGTIAEQLASLPEEEKQNISTLIFDTMGIFWTMKYKNDKEKELLKTWDLKPEKLPVRIFIPYGYYEDYEKRGIPVDNKFAIKPSELGIEDWVLTFNLGMIDPVAVLIEKVINHLKENEEDFSIKEITNEIYKEKASEETKNAAVSLFEAAQSWKVFAEKGEKGTDIRDLVIAGEPTILDLSPYSSIGSFNVRALVIGLICKKLFNYRMLARKLEEIQALKHGEDYLSFQQKREMPLVWLFIDEAHEFIGKETTAASAALIQLLREGRQPGISIVMATQQPGQLHHDAMTQSDIVISHRVTAAPDINALNEIMQTYLLSGINKYLDDLPSLKGSAIILDDNSERIYPMRVKPRVTWHGGEAPTSVKVEKRLSRTIP